MAKELEPIKTNAVERRWLARQMGIDFTTHSAQMAVQQEEANFNLAVDVPFSKITASTPSRDLNPILTDET